MGLRELKKAKTRKMISDLATRLFFKKGYDAVTTAEIARMAEISVPTLFNYFPTKESLVFDEDQEREEQLVRCVLERKKGTSVLGALCAEFLANIKTEELEGFRDFQKLIDDTPALALYERNMWMRHVTALAHAIRKSTQTKLGEIESEAIANFVLDSFYRSLKTRDPKVALRKLFQLFESGCKGL